MKKILFLTIILLFGFSSICYSLKTKTHRHLNDHIGKYPINGFSLDLYLKEQLGFPDGRKEMFDGKEVFKWLNDGGEYEDSPPFSLGGFLTLRYLNHFHNPLTDLGFFDTGSGGSSLSTIEWFESPAGTQNSGGNYSWYDVREYFYHALTDQAIKDREENFADTFRGLGQLMHLVQDMSVPLHTRNDGHLLYSYEKWVADNHDKLLLSASVSFDQSAIGNVNPISSIPAANLFDTNQYDGPNPDPAVTLRPDIGLAEYSCANFLSRDTMFTDDFPFPKAEHCVIVLDTPPNGIPNLDRKYISSTNGHPGEQINHLAIVSYLDYFRKVYFPNISSEQLPVSLDPACYDEYASKLIPRAVGYSAGLLDYFFRGSLEVSTCVPLIYDNKIVSLNFTAKNVTASEETMSEGNFTVVVRYTPVGGNPDGSEDQFFRAEDVYCSELQYEDEFDFTVDLPLPDSPDSISFDVYDSIKCYLVFKGTLGAEEGAVIGKIFTLGEIKFREDWNNGLDGNHDWAHGQSPTEPVEGGETINNITTTNNQDTLIKENIRNADVEDGRTNQSALSLGGGNEILITPNTFMHFKIDNISVTPPSTIYLQALRIQFANGTWLQFCPDGQCDYPIDINWPPMDININIDSENALVTVNIHQLFQEAGIAIPEYLYLSYMNFIQLFEEGAGPATTQRMEIDFIRIVEETP